MNDEAVRRPKPPPPKPNPGKPEWQAGATKARLLRLFGRTRRPRSWVVFAIGAVGLLVTLLGAIPAGLAALDDQAVAWLLVMFQGMGEAQDAEDDLGTEGDSTP